MSLRISATSYGSLLSSVLMNKLPPEFQLIIRWTITGENWELDTLLQIVKMEISARERSETVSVHHTPQNQRSVPTAIFMSDNSPSTNCVYCNESHTPSFCKKFNTLNARKNVLKSSGHCFICLRKGHLAVNCRSGRRCYHCKGRHHGSICTQGEPMTHPQTRPSNSPPISTTSVNNITSSTTHNTSVFLQTILM